MYCTPWARLMKSITPKTSVSPAATRNRSTPSCSPFSAWTSSRPVVTARSAHPARGGVGIDRVGEDLARLRGLELAVGTLRHLAQPEILHREMVGAEAKI